MFVRWMFFKFRDDVDSPATITAARKALGTLEGATLLIPQDEVAVRSWDASLSLTRVSDEELQSTTSGLEWSQAAAILVEHSIVHKAWSFRSE